MLVQVSLKQKIKVYHFHNGRGGGVYTVMKNLLAFSNDPLIENHVIYTINKDEYPDYKIKTLKGAQLEKVFNFSPQWNFYYTCKQLAKLIPDEHAVIAAHDWLELGMMSNLGLQNPVVHFLHGDFDYYYDLAIRHANTVDEFIAISPVIKKKLQDRLQSKASVINYLRFPVPEVQYRQKSNDIIRLFYCVRNLTEERKQFKLLPLINQILVQNTVNVSWTIIGGGLSKQEVFNLMGNVNNISFYQGLTNEEVIELLPHHDIFILPSLQEGFPVAVVEAMKAGLVPIITDWDGATSELVKHGKTGFYIEPGNAENYANAIGQLNTDRALLTEMSVAASQKANELFDPYVNTQNIESVLVNAAQKSKTPKSAEKKYGSRLDQPWLPSSITAILRKKRK